MGMEEERRNACYSRILNCLGWFVFLFGLVVVLYTYIFWLKGPKIWRRRGGGGGGLIFIGPKF